MYVKIHPATQSIYQLLKISIFFKKIGLVQTAVQLGQPDYMVYAGHTSDNPYGVGVNFN